MKKLQLIILTFLLFGKIVAQELPTNPIQNLPKISFLDSIKKTFKTDAISACIDERWISHVTNADLTNEMFNDMANLNFEVPVSYDLDTELFKKRIKILDAKSPFSITYNPIIENVTKSFLKNRAKSFERQMALAEYYFPMFESHLAKYNIPLEVKYLAIVESALNPKAKSRVGASGIWQFMYETGKQYQLKNNSYVDERLDPMKATEAACNYFINMHKIFGDWSLVLASYNCGPGNVTKAIRKSGGSTDFWEIRKFLPKETANYVPAFIATMYIYEFKKEHGISPKKAPVTYFETDTIAIKRHITFKQIANLLDVSEEQLEFFNPTYKLNEIPVFDNDIYYLRLPKDKIGLFISNEDKVNAYLDFMETEKIRKTVVLKKVKDTLQKTDTIAIKDKVIAETKPKETPNPQKIPIVNEKQEYVEVVKTRIKEVIGKDYHKVKSGETLSEIADKHNVSTASLRKWNKIKGDYINLGTSLVIETKKQVTVKEVVKKLKKKSKLDTEENAVAETNIENNTTEKTKIDLKENVYVVQKGDSIFSISKKFPKTSIDELKKLNNLSDNNIKPGMKLKITG